MKPSPRRVDLRATRSGSPTVVVDVFDAAEPIAAFPGLSATDVSRDRETTQPPQENRGVSSEIVWWLDSGPWDRSCPFAQRERAGKDDPLRETERAPLRRKSGEHSAGSTLDSDLAEFKGTSEHHSV